MPHRLPTTMTAVALYLISIAVSDSACADELAKAFIDGAGPDWTELKEADLINVNCNPDTWSWSIDVLSFTGKSIGVLRTRQQYTNFELVVQWKHVQSGGNSGIFVWATADSIKQLKPGEYPQGIEVQILDHGFTKEYETSTGKKADWFTTHGDVFPVNGSRMQPFPPVAPDGERSFPRKQLSKASGQWNHYYLRCLNGEVRLWVNGEEVSGGNRCDPCIGYLCLEMEGAPIELKQMRIRE